MNEKMKRFINFIYFISALMCVGFFCFAAVSCRIRDGGDAPAETSSESSTETVSETETDRVAVVYSADGSVLTDAPDDGGSAENFSVYFLNAGRADAILIDADGKFYMIDTGKSDGADKLCDKLEALGVKTIEAVFLTHTHSDHIGGFKKLCKRFKVKGLFAPCYSIKNSDGEDIITKLAAGRGMTDVKLWAGDRVELCGGIYARVLGPISYSDADDNDNSLVLRVEVNGRAFLFTGDMQFADEYALMQSGADLSADVLKVGNHGNKDATSSSFADAVSPSIAVITTDTKIDPGSAANRVIDLFDSSEVYITGDSENWLRISVSPDGTLSAVSG